MLQSNKQQITGFQKEMVYCKCKPTGHLIIQKICHGYNNFNCTWLLHMLHACNAMAKIFFKIMKKDCSG